MSMYAVSGLVGQCETIWAIRAALEDGLSSVRLVHRRKTRSLGREYRPQVFQNGMLTRIFGTKRNKIIKECRKFHNKELHNI
jgi:hypothetical protein